MTNELINRDGYDGESYWKRNETGGHERRARTAERRIMIIDGFQRECIEQAQLNRIDMVKDAVTGTATAKSYNAPAMQGWICPVCGRGVSPYTAVCPCKNGKGWQGTS